MEKEILVALLNVLYIRVEDADVVNDPVCKKQKSETIAIISEVLNKLGEVPIMESDHGLGEDDDTWEVSEKLFAESAAKISEFIGRTVLFEDKIKN